MQPKLPLEIPQSGAPLYVRIAEAIASSIRAGRFRAGEPLPSTRTLALELDVHRNTVIAAYGELRAQGLIDSARARGTFVAQRLPPAPPPPAAVPTSLAERSFPLPALSAPYHGPQRAKNTLLLLGGLPELRFPWTKELGRAYAHTLRRADVVRLLDYGDPRGQPHLRQALADFLRKERGLGAPEEGLVVLRGALHGLYLITRALLRPGDRIGVEELGHPAVMNILRLAGLELVPVPIDQDGLEVDALEELCKQRSLKAIYVTPHHQLPTTVSLSPGRRARLLELAQEHSFLVVEDDYDHEFHYEGPPRLPLAATDRAGVVVYLGSFSKVLAPGLRTGFLVAAPRIAQHIADYRAFVDWQGDHIFERTLADLLNDGDVQRWMRRARKTYLVRRNVLCDALRRAMPELEFRPPDGGMAIWVRAPGTDSNAWAARAEAHGVAFQSGSLFGVGWVPKDCLRVGFAACNPRELAEAVRRMAATLSP